MKKFKYFLIPIIIIIAVIAFIFPSIIDKPVATKNILEEMLEVDHSKEIQEVLTKFDSIYNANILESGAVGGAVVITYKGQIAMLKCFGERKAGENSPVNENTVFRLASVSKSVTGVLSGILASENEINLDDKVVDYLPGFKLRLQENTCLLYTSDAADERSSVDLGGRRIIKKTTIKRRW